MILQLPISTFSLRAIQIVFKQHTAIQTSNMATSTSMSGRAVGGTFSKDAARGNLRQSRRPFFSGSAPIRHTVAADRTTVSRGAAMDIRCEKVRHLRGYNLRAVALDFSAVKPLRRAQPVFRTVCC